MPGYDIKTDSGQMPNPSESGYFEFGTDKQLVRAFRIRSDGSVLLGDGTVLDTTVARLAAGSLGVNGVALAAAGDITSAVAVETARATGAEALLLPKTGGTISGSLVVSTNLTVPATRNFNETFEAIQTVAQTAIPAATNTAVVFDTVQQANAAIVTPNAGKTLFTVGPAGKYQIETGWRVTVGGTQPNLITPTLANAAGGAPTVIYACNDVPSTFTTTTFGGCLSRTRTFAAGDTIALNINVSGSGAWATGPVGERVFLTITYLGP
jgi:hypothetical protein